MPKGFVSSSKMKMPMEQNGNKILNVKEDIFKPENVFDYVMEYSYSDILDNPNLCVNGSPFEMEIKYPEDLIGGVENKTIFHRFINNGILNNYKINENRVKSFTIKVVPPNVSFGVKSSYLNSLNGGYFIYILPYAKNELNDIEKMLSSNIKLTDTVKSIEKINASECFHFETQQGSFKFNDSVIIPKNKIYFIPFGFSQTIGFGFNNDKSEVLPPIRPGGRPQVINKYPSHRIVFIVQVNLSTNGLCKTLSVISNIQEKTNLIGGGANRRRNKIVSDLGAKLILKTKEDNDEDNNTELSVIEISKSIVKLIKGNKMILGFFIKSITSSIGKSHPELAKLAITTIGEITKMENIDDAISKMKDLILSNEKIASIIVNFMGENTSSTTIETYDD